MQLPKFESAACLCKSKPSLGLDRRGHSCQNRGWDSCALLHSSWAWSSFGAPSSKDMLGNGSGCSGWLPRCLVNWKIWSKSLLSRESHSRSSPDVPSNLTFSRIISFLTLCSYPGQTSSLQSWRERWCTKFSAPRCSTLQQQTRTVPASLSISYHPKCCCKHLSRWKTLAASQNWSVKHWHNESWKGSFRKSGTKTEGRKWKWNPVLDTK